MIRAYITGIAAISPQNSFESDDFLDNPVFYNDNFLTAIDADYKQYINPVQIRRMSRVMKMGLSTAKKTIEKSGITSPDAILTGTGYGCIDDTEKFLLSILENKEQLLNPTAFMQSTHNAVSGIVALNLHCKNYNFTYVHRGFSLDHCILDAGLLLKEGKKNILIGAFEENSRNHQTVTTRIGFWKKNKIDTQELLKDNQAGSVSGEGAMFMMLSDQSTSEKTPFISGMEMLYKPKNKQEVISRMFSFLERHHLQITDIDVVLLGVNGDPNMHDWDAIQNEDIFSQTSLLYYKHLCGEYYSSSSFALFLASKILTKNYIPQHIQINKVKPSEVKRVLVYNHYRGINHSFYLLGI